MKIVCKVYLVWFHLLIYKYITVFGWFRNNTQNGALCLYEYIKKDLQVCFSTIYKLSYDVTIYNIYNHLTTGNVFSSLYWILASVGVCQIDIKAEKIQGIPNIYNTVKTLGKECYYLAWYRRIIYHTIS